MMVFTMFSHSAYILPLDPMLESGGMRGRFGHIINNEISYIIENGHIISCVHQPLCFYFTAMEPAVAAVRSLQALLAWYSTDIYQTGFHEDQAEAE